MKTGEFVIAFLKRSNGQIIKRSSIDTHANEGFSPSWRLRNALAVATETIDYGCNFNRQGLCKKDAPEYKGKTKKDLDKIGAIKYRRHPAMCCCGGCYGAVGYLNEIPADLDSLNTIAELYDAENQVGFWRKDKGCALPRKYRSDTCLGHHCYPMNRKERFLLMLLSRNRYSENVINLRKKVYRLLMNIGYNDVYKIRQATDKVFDDFVMPAKKLMKELDLNRKRLR